MKKIIPLVFGILLLLPITNAFAYNDGLLDGKPLINPYGSPTNLATDRKTDTTMLLNTAGSGQSLAYYLFESPVTLNAYQLLSENTAQPIKIWVKKSDDSVVIVATNAIKTAVKTNIPTITDVKTVYIENMDSKNAPNIAEFDVFGSTPISIDSVTNLSETHTYNSTNLSWVNPKVSEFEGVIIKKDGLEVAQLGNTSSSYTINGLDSETSYVFEIIAKFADGSLATGKTITVVTDIKPVDSTAPSNISNVSVVKTHESVNFLYVLPVDTDFSHLEVFRDGDLIEDNLKDTNYHDFGLVANTSYVYKFVSVDLDGNKSSGYVQSVLTDSETDSIAPDVPKGVTGVNANAAGRISWSRNSEPDISGYNLYVDGVKYNTSLILASNYTINGLQNGTSYTITVSAVDTSGNESAQSSPVTLNPSESEMPIFSSKFDLKDVADGTNNWFMSLWPILAFSVGITLAFIVARRVKLLFFA